MRIIRFIGDVHGRYEPYKRLIADVPASIQLGDMGVGFRRKSGPNVGEAYGNPPHYAMVAGNHRFIRGNHDAPAACQTHSQWIPDGTVENDMMFIGGALSIDKEWRHEGYDWWPDEELSIAELNILVDVYAATKPRIMVTHDCPEVAAMALMNRTKLDYPSRTRQAFQSMFEVHQPEKWLHGHWHLSSRRVINGTRFICLAEHEFLDVEV